MVEAANPALVQEFTLYQPLSDDIPAKVHPFSGIIAFNPQAWQKFLPFCRNVGNGVDVRMKNCIFAVFSASRAVRSRLGLSHSS
ncbi:hypothetical protein [Paenibacillus dendritiformis]|uniref:hypothetical protein n=1 Tax=Paenibacillus dendritiformis TaxID=130049 RepID=UPI0011B578AD|nr:hypothetical protein [Paenibacillus dendritiformis]